MPNTTSAPTCSSERTSACAPVMVTSSMPLPFANRAQCIKRPLVQMHEGLARRDGRDDLRDAPDNEYELQHEAKTTPTLRWVCTGSVRLGTPGPRRATPGSMVPDRMNFGASLVKSE